MASFVRRRPASWFTPLAVVLVLWGLLGCWAFYMHLLFGASMKPEPDAWERAYNTALPGWFTPLYSVAIGGGVLGSVALLLRSRLARPLYIVSFVAVILQFGFVFGGTNLIAHKGAAAAIPFPLLIAAVALLQLWVARHAERRGWIA